ncbi:peptidylprolyl isomerase [Salinarimonas sp. NSM]|uniref:peptidylprolyl isomerase n=1 Tax=Salinarimonas sp. NSM TaxID=3458003 RepID=UPI0040364A7B
MSACSVRQIPNAPRRPIRVGGKILSHAMIAREVQNHPALTPVAAWKQAALALVLREALAQEAERQGVVGVPRADAQGRRETQAEADQRALVEREVVTPEPTEDECRRFYETNRERFRAPTLYEAAHILVGAPREDEAAFAAALDKAGRLAAHLKERPGDLAELARLHSTCPSAEEDGHLGQVRRGETTPEFEAAMDALAPGAVSDPVGTRYGVHVVRLDRRIEGRILPFEAVEGRIAAYLREAVRRRAEAQYVARLLAASAVEGLEIPAPGALNVL